MSLDRLQRAARAAARRRICSARRRVLNAGENVAMLVGQGAKGAADEVLQVADVLGAGIAKALNGRAVIPDDLPFVTGSIGLLGTKPTDTMIESCDTLLMVGSSFPYSEWLPKEGQARAVQIDIDGRMIGHPVPDGGQPRRRRDGDPARAAAAARAQAGPLLARDDRGRGRALVEDPRRARARQRQPAQSATAVPRAVEAAPRSRDPDIRFGLGDQLVGPPR